jgi:hypothetical protein
MRKFTLVLCLLVSAFIIHAQAQYEEVVYLKNGSVIHGMIVEFVPNVSIKIKSGENLFAYKLDEIEKITREIPSSATARAGGFGFKPKGYVGIVELGLTDFPIGGNLPMFSLNIINAYQFNPYFALGAGVGVDVSSQKIYEVPVTMDMRAYFTKTRVAPFFAMGLGYNLQVSSSPFDNSTLFSHGMVFNPSFGARIAINKKVALSLALGYKLLGVKYNYSYNDSYYSYYGYSNTVTVNQFTLSHGITLKAGIHF